MRISAITLILVSVIFLSFGQNMLVHTNGSSTPATYPLATIDSITFVLPSPWVALHDPVLAVQFSDNPTNHNMHIASDGAFYYTINGGSVPSGKINKYTLAGVLVASYPIAIDGRGLSYNKADGFLYASLYGGDIVKITSLAAGTFTTVFAAKMTNGQASFAISPDGTKMYDFASGTVKVYNFQTGALLSTYTGLSYGAGNFGGEFAIAVDDMYMYTWDATIKTVYVYTLTGTLVRSMVLPSGSCGLSLSFIDGYLFVAIDGNYAAGTWYGYNIRRALGVAKKLAPVAVPAVLGKSAAVPVDDSTRK
jgi:hypothetical protein